MKKMFALLLAVLMVAALFTGCGKSSENVLTVATSPDFVDSSKTGQDQYVGFDIMLAKYIADELGMELEILPMSFDSCPTAVTSGKATLAISGFSWMEDRAANYNLSDYYYAGDNETEQVIITLKDKEGQFASVDDFAGMKIGAQNASLQEQLCQEQLPGAEIVTIGDLSTALMQLKKGDFDFIAVAKGQADVFLSNDPDVALSGFEFDVDPKYVGNLVILKKGDDEMTEKVNAILAKAEAAGLYAEWYEEAEILAGSKDAQEISYDDNGSVAAD